MQDQTIPPNWAARFFTIWTGQAFSLFGSSLVQFPLVWWLTQKTGSATVLATSTMAALLPQIILGPFAGALVDRWNRRIIMIVADTSIALATLLLVYLFATDQIQVWHIYAIAAVRSRRCSRFGQLDERKIGAVQMNASRISRQANNACLKKFW